VNPSLAYPLAVAASYVVGSVPFGFLISRMRGIDIREHGSRNIGATNVLRVLGKTWGFLTFFCDAGKGIVAVLIAKQMASVVAGVDPSVAGVLAAMGCILGHSFPVWLGFRGGKGVATSLGVILGLMPLASAVVLGLWLVVFRVSRYVSLASIVAAAALPPVVFALLQMGRLQGWVHFYFALAAAVLVVRRHRENILRLKAGTENRFGQKKQSATDS
jgi:glycerol-3-phosphate acyltransferase PlsY